MSKSMQTLSTPEQLDDLILIEVLNAHKRSGQSPTYEELSEKLRKTVSTVQYRVQLLIRSGYLSKSLTGEDMGRRARALYLTEKGAKWLTKYGATVPGYIRIAKVKNEQSIRGVP